MDDILQHAITTEAHSEQLFEPLRVGQLARHAVAAVEEIHKTCLKTVQEELAELLQVPVSVNFLGAAQPNPTAALNPNTAGTQTIRLDLAPLQEPAFLEFPPSILFRVLDILLATPESATSENIESQPARSVTGIELYILREFFEVFAKSLRLAWAPVYAAAFVQLPPLPDEDSAPSPPSAISSALVLSTNIELAGLSAEMHLILPTFLARMAQLRVDEKSNPDGQREPAGGILHCLGSATLSVDAVLQGASIRIRDLLAMAPGQILAVGNTDDIPFGVLVNGCRRFAGSLAPSGGQCSLQIETVLDETGGSLNFEPRRIDDPGVPATP